MEGSLPPVPVLCRHDSVRVGQVVGNLLSNAIKYSPQGGPVLLELRVRAGQAVLAVSDQGVGVLPEERERIFEPFYSTKQRGTGLGLTFTQQVVKEHGGSIRCEREVGRGTSFTVRLPAEAEETVGTVGATA